jgi:nitrate reductase NapD
MEVAMNVSSIVVQAKTEYVEDLVEFFKNCGFCDYHFHDTAMGKIILTVEGEGVDEEIKHFKSIQTTPHVISAEMMMAYSEDELERERAKLIDKNPVPSMLEDEHLKAEEIRYYGDLKKKKI